MKRVLTQIRRRMREMEMTQADLSRATGISPTYLSDMFRGHRADVMFSTLLTIARGLDCELALEEPRDPRNSQVANRDKAFKPKETP